MEVFGHTKRISFGARTDIFAVRTIIVKRLGHISDFSLERHCRPDPVIAAHAESFVRSADLFVYLLAEDYGTRVRDWIAKYKVPSALLKAIDCEVCRPMVCVDAIEI